MQITYDRHAKTIITALYEGEIIDWIRHKDMYSALNDAVVLDQINQHFAVLDKRCARTKDGGGFFLYCVNQDKEALQLAEDMLREVIKVIRPMIEWLQFTRSISVDDVVITTGTELRMEQLVRALDQQEARNIMQNLASAFARSNTLVSANPNDHLKIVLSYLERNDYLIKAEEGLVYLGLAKWSVFEEALNYLAVSNNVPRVDETQENLF